MTARPTPHEPETRAVATGEEPAVARYYDQEPAHRPKLLVYLFSLIPGAGHMYLGLMSRGLQLMTLFFGTLFITGIVGRPLEQLWPAVIAPVLWFYSFFDSLQTAGRLSHGEVLSDSTLPFLELNGFKWGKAVGWLLLGLGALALLNNLGFMIPVVELWIRRLLGPALLIALGAWLLLRESGNAGRAQVDFVDEPVGEPVDEEE